MNNCISCEYSLLHEFMLKVNINKISLFVRKNFIVGLIYEKLVNIDPDVYMYIICTYMMTQKTKRFERLLNRPLVSMKLLSLASFVDNCLKMCQML